MLVFGGTFNPPHRAHLEIIHRALKEFNEEILIVPAFTSPFKEKDKDVLPYSERFELMRLALFDYRSLYPDDEFKKVVLSDIEKKIGGKVYTSILIERLKSEKKIENRVRFLAGSDILKDLDKWYDVDYLKSNVEFVIYKREKTDLEKMNLLIEKRREEGFCIKYLGGDFIDITSSDIRNKGKFEYLTENCREYYLKLISKK